MSFTRKRHARNLFSKMSVLMLGSQLAQAKDHVLQRTKSVDDITGKFAGREEIYLSTRQLAT